MKKIISILIMLALMLTSVIGSTVITDNYISLDSNQVDSNQWLDLSNGNQALSSVSNVSFNSIDLDNKIRLVEDSGINYLQSGDGTNDSWQPFRIGKYMSSETYFNIDDSGNVGIGTDSPSAKLEVSDNIETNLQITSIKDGSWATDQVKGQINFYGSDVSGLGAGNHAWIKAIAVDTFGANTGMSFGTSENGGEATEKLRIDQSGNVGIGTDSPVNGKLVVSQSADNENSGIKVQNVASASGRIWVDSSDNLQINRAGQDPQLVLDSTGNVGIGTTSPTGKLHIKQDSADDGIFIDQNGNSVAFNIDSESSTNEAIISDSNINDDKLAYNFKIQGNTGLAVARNDDLNQDVAIRIGNGYYLWVDSTGDLRINNGNPSSDTDGAVVGAQS